MQNVGEESCFFGLKLNGIGVPNYLVSPQDKVVIVVLTAELEGTKLLFIVPQVKRCPTTLNCFQNLVLAIAG